MKRLKWMAWGIVIIGMIMSGSGCTKVGYWISSVVNPLEPFPIVFEDGVSSAYYTITTGDKQGPETVLFFIGGSGCASLQYYLRQYFHELHGVMQIFALQKRKVSDRTTGMGTCPQGFDEANHFKQWVSDQSQFLTAMLAQFPHMPTRVVVFGVSEGGNVAAALAASHPTVTHLVLIGSGGMPQREELRILLVQQGYPGDVEGDFQRVANDPESVTKRLYGQTHKYWTSVLDVDPLTYLLPLQIPILVGFGERDQSVPHASLDVLQQQFAASGKTNLTVKIFSGADHTLKDTKGHSFKSEFFAIMESWLSSQPAQCLPLKSNRSANDRDGGDRHCLVN
jgi:pimeloyl-ACP methyl ester carboxylesterase